MLLEVKNAILTQNSGTKQEPKKKLFPSVVIYDAKHFYLAITYDPRSRMFNPRIEVNTVSLFQNILFSPIIKFQNPLKNI
jgi:hypothetical protein